MKLRTIQKSLSAAVIPLIAVTLLSMLLMGCDREDAPKKEKQKAEAYGKTEKSSEKPEEADVVILSPEQVRATGIEAQKVVPGVFHARLSATATIEPNNDRLSRIGSRVAGRVTRVMAAQGDRVKAGQPLAYLESDAT